MKHSTHHLITHPIRTAMAAIVLAVTAGCGLFGGGGTTPAAATQTAVATASIGATKAAETSVPVGASAEAPLALLGDLTPSVVVGGAGGRDHEGVYGEALTMGARLTTNATGRARVLFSNGASVRLAPSTQLTLTEHEQTVGNDWLTRLQLVVGQVWAIVPTGSLSVETPVGVGAVRGSFMGVIYIPGLPNDLSDDIFIVVCLEGNCTVTINGVEMQFSTGQKVVVTGGQLPEGPQSLDQADIDDWIANNPEILILFRGAGLTPGPEALATLLAQGQAGAGGIVVGFPVFITFTPTNTPTATPTHTPQPAGPAATNTPGGTIP